MLGFFSGVLLSVWFRNDGPQKPVYEWMTEGIDIEEIDNEIVGNEENEDKHGLDCDSAKKE